MWYLLTAILLGSLLAIHLWWKRRWVRLRDASEQQQQILCGQQQRHDQALAEKQAQQEALFNSMAEGVLVLDSSGRIDLINQSLRRLFALTAELRGQTILEAFRLQELAAVVERLKREQLVRG